MADEPQIASAVGASSTVRGRPDAKELGQRLEQAMSDAVTQALADGISMENTEEIKARMMAAREAVFASVPPVNSTTEER